MQTSPRADQESEAVKVSDGELHGSVSGSPSAHQISARSEDGRGAVLEVEEEQPLAISALGLDDM